MKQIKKYISLGIALVGLVSIFPVAAQGGNVGWNVSVGGGNGGGWRPAAYGPGWGGHYGPGWRGNWAYSGGYYGGPYGYSYPGYYSPPVVYAPPVAYALPPPPLVLTSQPQPAVWYFCQASGQYFPYVQECASGWQAHPAIPPSVGVKPHAPSN